MKYTLSFFLAIVCTSIVAGVVYFLMLNPIYFSVLFGAVGFILIWSGIHESI